jgi:hypothetical protein
MKPSVATRLVVPLLHIWEVPGPNLGQKNRKTELSLRSLFNDAFSGTHNIQRRINERQMNDELQRMWKEAVVA